ncbi:sugar phosphate isomerase/epimerase [Butyricicoccus faecihominis]|uniref:sugar phosphate isomerase/epimerase family protein n=1 Tax=Butyricicoccus faecihominis TaxID=1712515 RepID=UPI002478C7D0|nr:sugar phosphate isomerase/epimerase [Butyricicoccus faecihominis]MCQ5129687.1 sugar phosphate isomerase/epimerase [Butyricicoccus faecihominis]
MVRIGISTACFYPEPIEEALPVIAGLGVHAIEVFVNTESEFSPAFAQSFGAQARSLGLDIVSVHPFTSLMEGILLFSDYSRRTDDGMRQYERYFTFAESLGARFLTFHGERDMGGPDDPARFAHKAEIYRRLCALGASHGVTLAQENVAWCKSKNPAFLRNLYEAVPELHFTLDIKQARRAGRDPREFIEAVGERIVNIHINDFDANESCLLPGAGNMDYGDFFSRMRAVHYDGHALIEVYRSNFHDPAEFTRSLRVLSRYGTV